MKFLWSLIYGHIFFFTAVVNVLLLGCVKSCKEKYLPLDEEGLEYSPSVHYEQSSEAAWGRSDNSSRES